LRFQFKLVWFTTFLLNWFNFEHIRSKTQYIFVYNQRPHLHMWDEKWYHYLFDTALSMTKSQLFQDFFSYPYHQKNWYVCPSSKLLSQMLLSWQTSPPYFLGLDKISMSARNRANQSIINRSRQVESDGRVTRINKTVKGGHVWVGSDANIWTIDTHTRPIVYSNCSTMRIS